MKYACDQCSCTTDICSRVIIISNSSSYLPGCIDPGVQAEQHQSTQHNRLTTHRCLLQDACCRLLATGCMLLAARCYCCLYAAGWLLIAGGWWLIASLTNQIEYYAVFTNAYYSRVMLSNAYQPKIKREFVCIVSFIAVKFRRVANIFQLFLLFSILYLHMHYSALL